MLAVEAINDRFDRVERKLDKLSDAMVSLARTEEKIAAIEADRSNTIERLNRHSEKIDDLTVKLNSVTQIAQDNSKVTDSIYKLIWVIVTAVVTAAVGYFFM